MRGMLGRWLGRLSGGARAKSWQAGWAPLLGGEGSAAELRRAYANSVWVSAAIKHVTRPLTAVPLGFWEDRRSGDVEMENPELAAFWKQPAKARGGMMNFGDFVEAWVGWMKLAGEAFWILDDSWLVRGRKSPLLIARPDEMRELWDATGLIAWTYTPRGGGKPAHLLPEQVVQSKMWNPYDDFRGLSEWQAAKIASESDYAAAVFARNLAQNNGDGGPYVVGKDGAASPEQVAQITAMLRQKRELSRRGEFRPVFLTGDIDVKTPTIQAVDAAFVAQRLENRHEIYAAFGVPMSFAEVMSSYSVGSASDRFRLIEDTCKPLGEKFCDAVETVTAALLGGVIGVEAPVYAALDWDEHSTMQEVRRERFDAAAKAVDRGMPWKEASDYFALRMPRFPGDDVGRVPFNLVEIGTDRGDTNPTPANAEGDDALEELEKVLRAMPAAPAEKTCGCSCGKAAGDGKPNATWEKIQGKRRPWEKLFATKIRRLLMDARAETLRKLAAALEEPGEKALVDGEERKALDVLSILFDLGEWLPRWLKALTDVERNALMAAGLELWTEELGRDDPLVMPAAQVQTAIALRENRLRNAGAQVWERVRRDLQKAIDEGAPNRELAAAVKQSFKGISDQRAVTIAQTETTVVYETGRDMVFREAGVQWTQWLHSGLSEHARPTHQAAHGQIREVGEPFDIGGVPMMFPGDPDAPADEVICCKCVRGAVGGPDQDDIEWGDEEIPY